METFDYKKLLIAYMRLVGDWEGVTFTNHLYEGLYGLSQAEIDEVQNIEKDPLNWKDPL